MESKDYSWDYVTGDRCVRTGPCELVSAYLVPSAGTTDSALYDGTDSKGKKIADLKEAAISGHPFSPLIPIYCAKGLFVDVGTSVSGILVQWRNL